MTSLRSKAHPQSRWRGVVASCLALCIVLGFVGHFYSADSRRTHLAQSHRAAKRKTTVLRCSEPSALPSVPPAIRALTQSTLTEPFVDCWWFRLQDVKPKRVFFSATIAHAGTGYLAALLDASDGVFGRHEDEPNLVSFPAVMRHGREATFSYRGGAKLTALYRRLVESDTEHFADISHLFLKSWADVTLKCMVNDPRVKIEVLVLRRWLPDVVRSLLSDGMWALPKLESFCGSEYTVHHKHAALLPPLKPFVEEDALDLALGHLLDTELQTQDLRKRYPNLVFKEIRLEEFSGAVAARRFVESTMGLTIQEPKLNRLITQGPVNKRVFWKAPELMPIGADFFLARAQVMIEAYEAAGVELPPFDGWLDWVGPCTAANNVSALPSVAPIVLAEGSPDQQVCRVPFQRVSKLKLAEILARHPGHPVYKRPGQTAPAVAAESLPAPAQGQPVPLNYLVSDAIKDGVWFACPV